MRPYRRRYFLVADFQYRLLASNLLYFFTILLILAAALFLPLIIQLKSGMLSWVDKQEVASQFLSLHTRLWPAIFVLFVLLAIHSIVVSHRIAGPLYRFRAILKAVAEGDLSVRATIRKHDYLGKEADIINEAVASVRTRIKSIQEEHKEIHGILTALKRATDSGSGDEMNQHLERLGARMERLRVYLDQFRTAAEETRGESNPLDTVGSASTPGESPTIAQRSPAARQGGVEQAPREPAPPQETRRKDTFQQ